MTQDVFDALANPMRRELLAMLRVAGLVREEPRGRESYSHLDASPLRTLREWLADYEVFWTSRLDNLHTLLNEEPHE